MLIAVLGIETLRPVLSCVGREPYNTDSQRQHTNTDDQLNGGSRALLYISPWRTSSTFLGIGIWRPVKDDDLGIFRPRMELNIMLAHNFAHFDATSIRNLCQVHNKHPRSRLTSPCLYICHNFLEARASTLIVLANAVTKPFQCS